MNNRPVILTATLACLASPVSFSDYKDNIAVTAGGSIYADSVTVGGAGASSEKTGSLKGQDSKFLISSKVYLADWLYLTGSVGQHNIQLDAPEGMVEYLAGLGSSLPVYFGANFEVDIAAGAMLLGGESYGRGSGSIGISKQASNSYFKLSLERSLFGDLGEVVINSMNLQGSLKWTDDVYALVKIGSEIESWKLNGDNKYIESGLSYAW